MFYNLRKNFFEELFTERFFEEAKILWHHCNFSFGGEEVKSKFKEINFEIKILKHFDPVNFCIPHL